MSFFLLLINIVIIMCLSIFMKFSRVSFVAHLPLVMINEIWYIYCCQILDFFPQKNIVVIITIQ